MGKHQRVWCCCLTEEKLGKKMEEFMTALDQVKKYRQLINSLADFALIIVASVIAVLSVNIIVNLLPVLFGYDPIQLNPINFLLSLVLLLSGLSAGVLWVDRKIASVRTGEWKSSLNEGTPGVLKLLQELKWETIFNDIRLAKLGFVLYGFLRILAYWTLIFIPLAILSAFLQSIIHTSISLIVVLMIALILVLILNRNDLIKRHEQIGNLDSLLWELRWFDSEFRRADFKA